MTRLEKRLFHRFEPSEIARARRFETPIRILCPRVGTVKATVTDDQGEDCEVQLELSAGRRGGMTLEARSTSRRGQAGEPCAALAAVLLEIDRRGLFSSIQDHTPLSLECVATGEPTAGPTDDGSTDDYDDEGETWTPEDAGSGAATTAMRSAAPRARGGRT